MLAIFSMASIEAQCNQACNLVITNKIDCAVQIKVTYICNGIQYIWAPVLAPGNQYTPSYTYPPSGIGCDCLVTNVELLTVAGFPPLGPQIIPSGGATTTFNFPPLTQCCKTNYTSYSACSINLWMSCP